jgi:hypothetical protein
LIISENNTAIESNGTSGWIDALFGPIINTDTGIFQAKIKIIKICDKSLNTWGVTLGIA